MPSFITTFLIRGLLICSCISTPLFAQEKLVFALDLIRHGDRTPTIAIPTMDYPWTIGLGQLTATGMAQEYQLGAALRKQYIEQDHLLPSKYNAETLYVRSSDYDRTLMSATSFLMGLYPKGAQTLPFSTKQPLPGGFQPIPIHTVPQDQDNVLLPRIERDTQQDQAILDQHPEWKQKEQILQSKFPAWSQALGISITKLEQLQPIGNALFIGKKYHVALPKGLSLQDRDEIIQAGQWVFVHAVQWSDQQASSSYALRQLITHYLEEASEKKIPLAYVVLFAHDSTQLNLMHALSLPFDAPPPYASIIHIALFEKKSATFDVEFSFNGKPMMIPGCESTRCSLKKFIQLSQ